MHSLKSHEPAHVAAPDRRQPRLVIIREGRQAPVRRAELREEPPGLAEAALTMAERGVAVAQIAAMLKVEVEAVKATVDGGGSEGEVRSGGGADGACARALFGSRSVDPPYLQLHLGARGGAR